MASRALRAEGGTPGLATPCVPPALHALHRKGVAGTRRRLAHAVHPLGCPPPACTCAAAGVRLASASRPRPLPCSMPEGTQLPLLTYTPGAAGPTRRATTCGWTWLSGRARRGASAGSLSSAPCRRSRRSAAASGTPPMPSTCEWRAPGSAAAWWARLLSTPAQPAAAAGSAPCPCWWLHTRRHSEAMERAPGWPDTG